MSNNLTVLEFERFGPDRVGAKAFDELKRFASYEDNSRILTLDGGGQALKARNYVGVIETKSGFVLEILPKIANEGDSYPWTKKMLFEMLRPLKDSPFVKSEMASLKTQKFTLLEVFIGMFAAEVNHLVRRGIKSDYIATEENQPFLKGKLLLGEQIRHNLVHQERFFVRYDRYSPDRPENRLIRSTIDLLLKKSRSNRNQQLLRELRFVFDEVEPSSHIASDLGRCKNDRTLAHYTQTMAWCRLFLAGESFTTYRGKELAFALLFPMERIFESFVAHCLKRHSTLNIKTQHSKHWLVENHEDRGMFRLRPDLVAFNDDEVAFVADTKWKQIDSRDRANKYGISQADMYQLFAYGKKYNASRLYLVYPATENFLPDLDIAPFCYEKDGIALCVKAFDIEKALDRQNRDEYLTKFFLI